MVNRYFFDKAEIKNKFELMSKLSSFINTDKDATKCSCHLEDWKNDPNRNNPNFIEGKAEKYGITT